ncbi:MAG: glycosyltransferase family 39 protein [Sedimenticola sp.]
MMFVAYFNKNREAIAYLTFLFLIVAILFITGAPTGGAFSWPDSPRHALNGAFVMDLIRDMPFDDPTGYAYNYYSQYPALTILFYPPLFYFVLAIFYSILGVSQEVALLVVFIFYVTLAYGTYFLARIWLSPSISFGVALLLISSPEVAFWGRQVMLEIPAYASLVWSAYCFIKYTKDNRAVFFYLSLILLLIALYTKLSVAFISFTYLIYLARVQKTDLFRKRHHYIGLALFIMGCIPLLYLTLKFGQANVQSASGISDSQVSRMDIQGWIWYAKALPSQIGWPAIVSAAIFVLVWFLGNFRGGYRSKSPLLLLLWFIVGYLFYSAIDLKEMRHSIFILMPVAVAAGLAFHQLFAKRTWAGGIGIIIVGALSLSNTVASRPFNYVDGYKDVVHYVSTLAPRNSNILFSGYRDGAFIFDMRAYSGRPDLSIVRADKLLLKISVRRSLGVEQKRYSEDKISKLINNTGVHYIVAQPDFWTDLDQMAKLQRVLKSSQFEEVRRFKMRSNYNAQEKELVVYRNLGEVATGPVRITNELPIIGRKIQGTLGNTNN